MLAAMGAASTTKYFLPPIGGWHSDLIYNPADPMGLLGDGPFPYTYSIARFNNGETDDIIIAYYKPTARGWRRIDAVTGEESYHPYVYHNSIRQYHIG